MKSSDKMWSTGEGYGKPLQYSCLENPMNSMKRTVKDELPRSVGAQYATEDEWRNNSRENEVKSLSRVRLFAIPWTVACQAPPSMEFSRQEYWSGLSFLSPGNPWPRKRTLVSSIAGRHFTIWATWEAKRMKKWSESKNNTQLWMWLVIEVKSDAVKSNIA